MHVGCEETLYIPPYAIISHGGFYLGFGSSICWEVNDKFTFPYIVSMKTLSR